MASSSSQALTKRSADTALMPPPPKPKRIKRPTKVLDEDVYSDALSHIIARDYFPGLLETQTQQEYLEALDSRNNDWIREAGRKLTQVMTPGPDSRRRTGRRGTSMTPRRSSRLAGTPGETPRGWAGDTPASVATTDEPNDDFAPEEKPEVDVNMSLGAFQSKYTSEDNESFNALLDKQNEKRAAKYAFFHHGNKIPSARQIAHRAREQKLLEARGSTSNALVTTGGEGSSKSNMALAVRPSQDLDDRTASIDGFKSTGPRNTFMFGPESIEDVTTTDAQKAQEASNAPPKTVQYANTRLPNANAPPEDTVPPSPSLSAIDAALAGRVKPTESEPGYNGAETPRVAGYAFVDAEPTPSEMGVPVTNEEADAEERAAVNRLLPDVEDGGPNPFKIHQASKREDLHLRMMEKTNAGKRKGGRLAQLRGGGTPAGRTPTPKFASSPVVKRGENMTPAARMLAAQIGTPRREGGLFGNDIKTEERGGWTPTPRIKRAV